MDSFKKYKSFSEFIIQPINTTIEEHEDIKNLRAILKIHSNYVKQEIITNCRAHRSIEDRVDYLKKIRSKLRELNGKLILLYDDNLNKDIPDKRNKFRKICIQDIAHILEDLKHFVSRIEHVPQKINFTRGKQQKYPSFKLIPQIHKEDIIEVCNELKQLKNLTIDSETDPEDFWQCFNGGKVITKVKWHRNNVLRYFITELAYYNLLKPQREGIWEIASNCFVNKEWKDFNNKALGKVTPLKNEIIENKITEIIKPLRDKRDNSKKTR
jgi:uncharacterized protein YqgV (UPF0045/DUF77 family)